MIKVIGKKEQTKYRVTCTDQECLSILEFDASDIRLGNRYSMGRVCGHYEGVVCPDCNQILDKKLFEVVE